jgi:hypothetical protein
MSENATAIPTYAYPSYELLKFAGNSKNLQHEVVLMSSVLGVCKFNGGYIFMLTDDYPT